MIVLGTWVKLLTVVLIFTCATAIHINRVYDPPVCPLTGSYTYPNNNCERYYICNDGNLQELACPSGQLFNRITLSCHSSILVNCYFTPLSPIPTGEPTTQSPLGPTMPAPSAICPTTGNRIVPIGDCVSYYNCTNGRYYQEQCGSGLLLDPISQQCLPFYTVSCIPQSTIPAPIIPTVCPPVGLELVPTGDCYTYYNCNNGRVYGTGTCPAGTLFDPVGMTCAPFNQVSCIPVSGGRTQLSPNTSPVVMCPPVGSIRYPRGDCYSFYQCTNGVYTLQQCPSGQLYNPSIGLGQCVPFNTMSCTPTVI